VNLRPLAAASLAVALAPCAVAVAAPAPKPAPPACNLLLDDKGDAVDSAFAPGAYPVSEAAVDIVSGDVASNAKVLTTVLRVSDLATSSPTSPTGLHWKFFLDINGTEVFTQAVSELTGATFSVGQIDPTTGTSTTIGDVTGVIDVAKDEVRVHVPLSMLPVSAKPGKKVSGLLPNAGRYVGSSMAASLSEPSDSAVGAGTYVTGARSCVVPGA
jgi:hypothetical protein